MNILVCCINFFNSDEVIEYVNNILLISNSNVHIAIIDNSNDDEELKKLETYGNSIDRIHVYKSSKNLGYLSGLLYGYYSYSKENNTKPQYVIFGNTDIEFIDKDFFGKLAQIDINSSIGVVAPSIISVITGKDQNPHMVNRISKKKLVFLKLIYSNPFLYLFYFYLSHIKKRLSLKQSKIRQNETTGLKYIYAPHGSYMILTNTFFEKFNYQVEYNGFLYSEEVYIAELCRIKDLKVLYYPQLRVVHNEHSTTSLISFFKRSKLQYNSIVYILDCFFK